MNVNYNSLSAGRDTLLKNGIGDSVGSPPISNSKAMKKSWLVMFVMILSMALGQLANAQTTLISPTGDGGFETGATLALNNWTAVNSTTDSWIAGSTPVVSAGTRCAFISSTPAGAQTWTYSQLSTIQHLYYDVTIPVGQTIVDLSFKWKVGGEGTAASDWDNMKVFWGTTAAVGVPVANTPLSAVNQVSGTGNVSGTYKLSGVTYGTSLLTLSGVAGSTYRLVFSWKSDSSDIVQPPAAIDEVSMISRAPVAPSGPPTVFSTTAITASGMTLNWVDSSTNETAFRVYRSTDNVTFTQIGTNIASTSVAGTGAAYTSVQSGLSAGTTYFYRIVSLVESESAFLTGSGTTTAGVTYYWVGASGGTWGTAANWNTIAVGGGSNRTTPATSDVLIVDGAGIIAGGPMVISHNVAGQTIGQLRVTSNTSLNLQSDTTTTRTTTISGGPGDDLVVDSGSTLNLINGTQACAIAFSGGANAGLLAGTVNFSGSASNAITTTGGTGTLVSVTGTVNIQSTFIGLVGSTATLSFAAGSNVNCSGATTGAPQVPAGTWATTSTLTVTGITTSSTAPTNNAQSFGNLVYNCPAATNTMSWFTSSVSGVIKGDLTVTAGAVAGTGIFRATTSGTLNVTGNVNVLQGRLQNASTSGTLIVSGNTTISAGGIVDILAGTYSQRGTTFTNNGTLTGVLSTATLQFLNFANVAQTYTGTGSVLTNVGVVSLQNLGGLTLSGATNQLITLRVNLFLGTITGSAKITLGTGLALGTVTQIGATGLLTPAGNYDAIPTFNLGSGTYGVLYAQESVARTTGFEIPGSRALAFLTQQNINGLTVAGGPLATTALTFSAVSGGGITTSTGNVLTVTGTTVGSVVRTLPTHYVNGPLALTLPLSLVSGSTYSFPIGKASLNAFALVNPTTNAGGTVTVQAEAFDGNAGGTPGINISAVSTTKYWAASITAGAANFTSALVQLNDVSTGRDAIAASATQGGAYNIQGGVAITTTATSLTTTAPENTTLPGFFLMGNKAAADITNVLTDVVGNQCTNVARVVTATITPGGGTVTSVLINYTVNGVAGPGSPIAMTDTTGNPFPAANTWSGTIPTVSPANANVVWSITTLDANLLTKTVAGTSYSDEPLFAFTASASASVTSICNSGSSVLTAGFASAGNGTIGNAVTTTGATTQPTAFCNRWPSYRMQTVYTAAELSAAGLFAGPITAMSLFTTTLGDGATNANFVVKIGTTALSVLSGAAFQSTVGYTTVFPSATYTHTASGEQIIPFSTSYVWDGTSNIIVDMIHSGADATNNAITLFTASAGNTVAFTTTDASNAPSYTNTRLNVKFAGTFTPTISSVLWSNGDTTLVTTVNPAITTVYSAVLTVGACTKTTNAVTVAINPIPNAPTQDTFASTCGTSVPTVSVSDPNAISGAIFKWYLVGGTTALQSNVSTTFLTAISATTTYEVSVTDPATGCESLRTSVTATIDPPAAIDPIANQAVCIGTGFSLTATSLLGDPAYSYTWTAVPALGAGIVPPGTGAAQTITPTVVGTYTYTVAASGGGCNTSTTFTATVSAFPVISSANASPATLCTDGISTLIARTPGTLVFSASTGASLDPMTGAATILASSNDDTVTAAPVNIGFSFTFNGVAYTQYQASPDGWMSLGATLGVNNFTNSMINTSNVPRLAPMWDDLATGTTGSVTAVTTGIAPDRILKVQWFVTSPRVTTGPANSTFQTWLYEGSNTIEYRYGAVGNSGGASAGFTIGAANFSSITFSSNTTSTGIANDLNAVAPVSGTMYTYAAPVALVSWLPVTDLYTDALATTSYSGGNVAAVYSKATANRSYNAYLTANGCTTASNAVTVSQVGEAIATLTGPSAVCMGSPTIPAGPITYETQVGATYASSNPAVATIDPATGILTLVSAGTTVISSQVVNLSTGCTNLAPNTISVVVSAPVVITTNPITQSVASYTGSNPSVTNFTVATTGSVASYRWQVSPSGNPGTWADILDADTLYTGQATATLSITNATTALYDGLFYHCVVSAVGPCATPVESLGAGLTVSDLAITDPIFGAPICGTGNRVVSVIASGSAAASATYTWVYSTDGGVSYDVIAGDFGGLTFPGGVDQSSLDINGLTIAENGWFLAVQAVSGATVITSNPTTIVVNVSQSVVTTGPSAVQDRAICFNSANSSTFTVSSTLGTGFQWQYSVDGLTGWNPVATAPPAGITYSGASGATLTVTSSAVLAVGSYYYRCSVAGPVGCPAIESNVASLSVTTPTITASASAPSLCGSGPSVLTASGAGVGGTYAWTASATLAAPLNLATVTATPTATTTYTVTGTTSAGCIASGTVTVTVFPAITASITATPSIVCLGSDSQLLATYSPIAAARPSNYSFVGSTGTYTPISGGNTTLATGDDGTDFPLPIGFNFTYNGTVYTDFGVTTNGQVSLGAAIGTFGWTNTLSSKDNRLAPLWDDNHQSAGNVTYQLSGTPGSQVLTVQWENISIGGGGSTNNSFNNFQLQLFEGTNVVKFNYGNLDATNLVTASIGISGAIGNFLSVTPGSPASSSTKSSVTENSGISSVANLPSGTSYTFTPEVLPTITYAWSPSTFLSDPNIANPIATAVTADTTYTVTVTTSAGGCSDTETIAVTVATPIAILGQPQPATFCQGATASLSVGATGAGLTYQWRKGGVDIFGEISSSITFLAATPADSGSYDVVIGDACGGTPVTSDAAVLTITPTPTVNAPTAWPSTVCAGTATATVALTGSVGATFNITGGAGIGLANQTAVSEIPSFTGIAGTATLSITPVIGTCTGTAISYVVTIQALPTAVTVSPATPAICDADVNAILLSGNGGLVVSSYCTPTVGSTGTTNDNITNFTFAGINNTTGDGPGDYNTYLSPSANVTAGTATAFSITPNPAFGQQFRVWVDMNQNGVYEASESVFNTTISTTVAVSGNITIPTTAFNGTTRMRVADRFSGSVLATEACGHSGFGEFEDYTVVITGGTAPPVVNYVWSSTGGGLFTDLAGTVAYTGTPSPTVYAKPAASATITATFTNAAGCTASGTSVITVNTATTWYADADTDGFGDLAVTQLACTQPVGFVANSTDCNPALGTVWQTVTRFIDTDLDTYGSTATGSVCIGLTTPAGFSENSLDCDDTNALLNPTNPCPTNSIVNLTLFIEGFYDSSVSLMRSRLLNGWDGVTPPTAPSALDVEVLTVRLHDAVTFAEMFSTTATLRTDGTLSASFAGAPSGSFYIAVKGSNMVETWSADPVAVGTTPLSYNFSSAAAQAYGANMIEVVPGVFAFYSGDFNQDGNVDPVDFGQWEIDYNDFAFGYFATDLTGDGNVDPADFGPWEVNYNNFISILRP